MRGALNTTADLYYGPQSPYGPPGTQYVSGLPCRFVPQTQIFIDDFPLRYANAWMTSDFTSPNVPDYKSFQLGDWYANVYTADMVAVPSGSSPQFFAVERSRVNPVVRPQYERCRLLPMADVAYPLWLPPSPPPGGVPPVPATTCAGASPLVDGVTSIFTIPHTGGPWWVRMPGTTTGVLYVSTSGMAQGATREALSGTSCAGLTAHGTVAFDEYTHYVGVSGDSWWVRFQRPFFGSDILVALRCSSSFI